MKSIPKKIISLTLVAIFSVTLLAGCFSKGNEVSTGGPQVLRILGGYGEDDWLRREWTDTFELTNDNVEIEIIPLQEPWTPNQTEEDREDPRERLIRILTEGIPPDVILLDYDISTLKFLVEEGLVQPLETFIEGSNISVDGLVPAIREGIREAGDGTSLYALAPTFNAQALFYNKDLFDQYGVPYPTDNMTWTQIADLAKQFPAGEGEDRIYGLWSRNGNASYYEFVNSFASPLGLTMFDADMENMMVNTPDWANALSEYVTLYTDGVLSVSPEYNMSEGGEWVWTPEMDIYYDAFYRGHAAMGILDSYEIQNLANRRMYDTEIDHFAWDVVTVPTHASAPGVGGSINYRGLMAINRNSQNANLAWEYIKFNNSEQMLKIKSRNPGQFVSVAEYNQQQGDGPANLQAFFALKPAVNMMDAMYSSGRNNENLWQVFQLLDQKIREVIQGDKSAEEALAELQTEGQEILEASPEDSAGQ